MPCDYKKDYSPDWKTIRADILNRAAGKCEFCGLRNYTFGARDQAGGFYEREEILSMNFEQRFQAFGESWKFIRIILTVAHLDHDTANNDSMNLKALCQRCHLKYDQEHHKANAAATRAARRTELAAQNGQLVF